MKSTAAAIPSIANKSSYVPESGPNAGKKLDLTNKAWDRMGLRMDGFHNYFRMEYKTIYELASRYEEQHMSLREFLQTARGLHSHLSMHHNIEEVHIFPILGKRMPDFAKGTGEHLKQHKQIHDGLDRYEAYLMKCADDSSEYSADKLRAIMDSFNKVLFQHLDEEVESLKGPNMCQYWTLEEVARIPI